MTRRRLSIPILFLLPALVLGAGLGAAVGLMKDLPQITDLERYQPPAASRMLATDGTLLAELFTEHRYPLKADAIPAILKEAVLATEDRNFHAHSGIDIKGICRAIVKDILAGSFVEGASTLTQQLAKTLFLSPDKKIVRKLREAILALQLERRYTKDEILTLYLNQIYLGSGTYGVEAASRRYFGKHARELSIAEAALIAGLPKAPSRYSPRVNPERSRRRRDLVLRQMREFGSISNAEYEAAVAEPVTLSDRTLRVRKAPWFVEQVRTELEQALGTEILHQGGLVIQTTLDPVLQQAAETGVATSLLALEERMKRRKIPTPPQGAVVGLDVETGAIRVMVGGRDHEKSPFNRATQARRQPGSAFKPIVFATAVADGMEQNRLLNDSPVSFSQPDGSTWEPKNYSKTFLGDVTARTALARSKNIPAIRVIEEVGPAAVARQARKMGITSPIMPTLSLALGTSETTLLELTAAYAVFPSGGYWNRPFAIQSVRGPGGALLYRSPRRRERALGKGEAAVMTDMLQAVVEEGTGKRGRIRGLPLGGKTGTTDEFRDALFVGFSPTLAVGVWTGCDDNRSLGRKETGARAALPVWKTVMEAERKADALPHYFPIPEGTRFVRMDPGSGTLFPGDEGDGVRVLVRTPEGR